MMMGQAFSGKKGRRIRRFVSPGDLQEAARRIADVGHNPGHSDVVAVDSRALSR